jgi:GntR family transcriptional regulator
MHFHISTRDGVPIYVQIVTQVKQMVASGRLVPGDELPTIRALAEQILVNPNTVARAYRELETAGVVATRRGSGTVIASEGSPLARKERSKILAGRADALVAEARHLGFSIEELIEIVRRRDAAMPQPDGREN